MVLCNPIYLDTPPVAGQYAGTIPCHYITGRRDAHGYWLPVTFTKNLKGLIGFRFQNLVVYYQSIRAKQIRIENAITL